MKKLLLMLIFLIVSVFSFFTITSLVTVKRPLDTVLSTTPATVQTSPLPTEIMPPAPPPSILKTNGVDPVSDTARGEAPSGGLKDQTLPLLRGFIEGLEIYRVGNRLYLKGEYAPAEYQFRKALARISSFKRQGEQEEELIHRLQEAIHLRLKSIQLAKRMGVEKGDSENMRLWDRNFTYLKRANQEITQAFHLALVILKERVEVLGEGNLHLIQDLLAEKGKGILVVTR